MPKGKATGEDRDYQILCSEVLKTLLNKAPGLKPYSGDGIDVEVPLHPTPVNYDVLLVNPDGDLIACEAKRWQTAVNLGDLAEFAHKIWLLRKWSGRKVAAILIAKTAIAVGAQRIAADAEIELVILGENETIDRFTIKYLEYDLVREKLLEDYLAHIGIKLQAKGSYTLVEPLVAKKPAIGVGIKVEVK